MARNSYPLLDRDLERLKSLVGGGVRFHYGTKQQWPGPNEVYFLEDSDTGEFRLRARIGPQIKELRQVDPSLVVANDGVIRLGNIAGGNYVNISPTTGQMTFVGSAVTWQDFRIPGLAVKLAGSSDPSLDVFMGGTRMYAFSDSANKEVHFNLQAPHNWKEGSTVYPHVHFSPNSNPGATATVRWVLEYTVANIGDTYPATNTHTMDGSIGTSDAKRHLVTPSTGLTPTGFKISCVRICRLYRDTSVANNYADKVFLLDFDFHFQIDSIGSSGVTTK